MVQLSEPQIFDAQTAAEDAVVQLGYEVWSIADPSAQTVTLYLLPKDQ